VLPDAENQLAKGDPVEVVVGDFEVFGELRVVFFSETDFDAGWEDAVL
jgi:hypothetical protein